MLQTFRFIFYVQCNSLYILYIVLKCQSWPSLHIWYFHRILEIRGKITYKKTFCGGVCIEVLKMPRVYALYNP